MAQAQLTVKVLAHYLPEQSNPEQDEYLFAYDVTIFNSGQVAAQLISRSWIITDGRQQVKEVHGPGVVGVQPLIQPGETFTYSSFCPLPTPVGSMRGAYQCVTQDGTEFEAPIAEFVLAAPHVLH
ncbi:MAG TPA: Co2+/Mg2+ efflux protein ApaG [Burkholderiaceae bacterium]|nr:Co2+/Mg2+ efflux protein ApaG [Burkholderiaceae bacterium]